MRIRTVPLHPLMPYGASELRAFERPRLAGAVMAGSVLWSAIVLVLWCSGVLRVGPDRKVALLPAEVSSHPITWTREPSRPAAPAPRAPSSVATTPTERSVPARVSEHPEAPGARPLAG